MELALAQNSIVQSLNRAEARPRYGVHEIVVYCPGCKTLETLWFNDGWLMQTRKFSQHGEQVFHDCGTPEPCRLYRHY